MAARRLLIVMLVLLGISTLAAALIPQESPREGTTMGTTTSNSQPTETTPPAATSPGNYFEEEVTVGGDKVPVIACSKRNRLKGICEPIRVGDRLTLRVKSAETVELEIPAFGLIGIAAPAAPARFELLFRSAATYGIMLTDSGRIAARIEVLPAAGEGKPGSGSGANPRARGGSDRA
jgi:hypothetical protein